MIKIGDSITLETVNGHNAEIYRCKLAERNDNFLFIDYPVNVKTGKTAFLLDGTQLKATFVAGDGSVFLFSTEVKGRVKQNIPLMILSYPGPKQLIKIQRRQYVRIEAAIDAAVQPINREFSPFAAVTEDISAGGASLLADKDSPIGAGMPIRVLLVLALQNGDYHYLKVDAKVVRVIDYNELKNKASIEFTDLSPADRQLLLRFCFDRQLALKKKGLEA
jgi:c-di-GMP-binding flagellar brake protein YcgR